MITKTALLPVEKAAQIQNTIGDFHCILQGIALAPKDMAQVVVVGDENNVKALFESIGESVNDEKTE